MARPRIFISSTYYDLKHIRADLERFVKEQGYEPILNERGNIAYGSTEKLEEYCYKEIELCDILVSLIGGRFGSESKHVNYSISNVELKTAIEKGRQVYIFIESSVYSEYRTFQANKQNLNISYAAVDDVRVYQFIEEVLSLPINNQVKGFETVQEITVYLREQWSGLFQRLLSENSRQKEVNLIEDLKNTSNILNQMVKYLIDEKSRGDLAIKNILFSNHPVFDSIQRILEIPYRVYFENITELRNLLRARQFEESDFMESWDIPNFQSWKKQKSETYLRISNEIFEEGRLKVYQPNEWNSKWVVLNVQDDDIPF